MITPQQRANHNTYLINEIEHIMKRLSKSESNRIKLLLDACFIIDDDLKYTKALKRTYLTACQAVDDANMD
mgnify:CR=1 FL=1